MPREKSIDPREELQALSRALKTATATAGRSLAGLAKELGFHPLYLIRALSGARRLRVDLVFRLLARLGEVPELFFTDLFPLGRGAYAELSRKPAGAVPDEDDEDSLRAAVRAQVRERGELTPREHELRAGELLRMVLHRAGRTQSAASQAVGLAPGALGQVLRGAARLTFFHTFGVLRFVGMTPGRFFFELFLPRPAEPAQIHERAALLDVIERLVEETSRGLLAQLAREAEGAKREGLEERADDDEK